MVHGPLDTQETIESPPWVITNLGDPDSCEPERKVFDLENTPRSFKRMHVGTCVRVWGER